MASRSKTKNFIKNYGVDKLEWLLEQFNLGTSGQVIADELGVSRERVRQWKNAFGSMVSFYQVHPDTSEYIQDAKKNKKGD